MYVAIDSSGNVSDTVRRVIIVNCSNGLKETNSDSYFSIYPNPSTDYIMLETKNGSPDIQKIYLNDIAGRTIIIEELKNKDAHPLRIDTKDLRSGMYFLRIETEKNSYVRKVEIELN